MLIPLIAIAGVGVGGLLAFWPRRAQADGEAKPPAPPAEAAARPPEAPPQSKIAPKGISPNATAAAGAAAALLGPGTAGVLGGGAATAVAGAAAVTATLAAGGAIGYGITGDALGVVGGVLGTGQQMLAVGGGFTFLSGQAGNVGRVVGREIDRVLNGSGLPGVTGSRVALEAAGFAAGLATVATSATMIPFVGQVFILVVAIASAAQDAARLQYGSAGLLQDATAEGLAVFRTGRDLIARRVVEALSLEALSPADALRVSAIAAAQAQGFAAEMNDQRRRSWERRPWGVGQTAESHLRWGVLRGLFLEQPLADEVHRRIAGQVVDGGRPVSLFDVLSSAEIEEHRARGRQSANWKNYLAAMAEPFAPFASADAHAAEWGRRGAFTGPTNAQGELVEGVVKIDWRRSLVEKRVITVEIAAPSTGPLPAPPEGSPQAPGNLGVSSSGAPKPPGNFALPQPAPPPAPLVVVGVKRKPLPYSEGGSTNWDAVKHS